MVSIFAHGILHLLEINLLLHTEQSETNGCTKVVIISIYFEFWTYNDKVIQFMIFSFWFSYLLWSFIISWVRFVLGVLSASSRLTSLGKKDRIVKSITSFYVSFYCVGMFDFTSVFFMIFLLSGDIDLKCKWLSNFSSLPISTAVSTTAAFLRIKVSTILIIDCRVVGILLIVHSYISTSFG